MTANSTNSDTTNYEALRLKAEKLPGGMYYRSIITPPYAGQKENFNARRYAYGLIGQDRSQISILGLDMHDPEPTYDQLYIQFHNKTPNGTHSVSPQAEGAVWASVLLNNQFDSPTMAKSGTVTLQRDHNNNSINATADLEFDLNGTTYKFKVELFLIANAPLP